MKFFIEEISERSPSNSLRLLSPFLLNTILNSSVFFSNSFSKLSYHSMSESELQGFLSWWKRPLDVVTCRARNMDQWGKGMRCRWRHWQLTASRLVAAVSRLFNTRWPPTSSSRSLRRYNGAHSLSALHWRRVCWVRPRSETLQLRRCRTLKFSSISPSTTRMLDASSWR